jgi:hypothetical protein
MGIEPTSEAWEASILPLYDARSGPKPNKPVLPLQVVFVYTSSAPTKGICGAPASRRTAAASIL